MPTMTEIGTKAGKVRDAMQKEASRLRTGDYRDQKLADTLVRMSHGLSATSLARLHDLLVKHPTKAAALEELQQG